MSSLFVRYTNFPSWPGKVAPAGMIVSAVAQSMERTRTSSDLDAFRMGPPPSGTPGRTSVATAGANDDALVRQPCVRRVEKRLRRDRRGVALVEVGDLHPRAGFRLLEREVAVRDALRDAVAVVAARHVAEDGIAVHDRLLAHRDLAVVDRQAAELPLDPLGLDALQRGTADEVALVHPHREAEAGLVRVVVGVDVGAPAAVALLQPQRVERAGSGDDETELLAGFDQLLPEPLAHLHRNVELPSELPRAPDPQRAGQHPTDQELPRRQIRESLAGDVLSRQRLDQRA